jgi:hypothetical protein
MTKNVNRFDIGVLAVLAAMSSLVPTAGSAEMRFPDVRLVVGKHSEGFRKEHFDEVPGVLVSSPETRMLRFESATDQLFELPIDRLIGLHYEKSKYPRRLFRRAGSYVTIHYNSAAGGPSFEIVRLSDADVTVLLESLERDTGLSVDRSSSTTSFLGLPVQINTGDAVVVIDEFGMTTKGMVTAVSAASLELDRSVSLSAGRIRTVKVSDPIWDGAVQGGLLFWLPAGLLSFSSCIDRCTTLGLLTPAGWGVVGAGALIGALIDGASMRTAYLHVPRDARQHVRWTPTVTGSRKEIQLSVRF